MIFADSENQGRKRYFMKIMQRVQTPYIVGYISLKKFDIFQFRL